MSDTLFVKTVWSIWLTNITKLLASTLDILFQAFAAASYSLTGEMNALLS